MTLEVLEPAGVVQAPPAAVPVQVTARPTEPLEPEPPAQQEPEPQERPLATTGQMATWLGQLEAVAGEPLSITITGLTHQVHVHTATLDDFRAWSDGLHASNAVRRQDKLVGWGVAAAVQLAGWEVTVRFYGEAVAA